MFVQDLHDLCADGVYVCGRLNLPWDGWDGLFVCALFVCALASPAYDSFDLLVMPEYIEAGAFSGVASALFIMHIGPVLA